MFHFARAYVIIKKINAVDHAGIDGKTFVLHGREVRKVSKTVNLKIDKLMIKRIIKAGKIAVFAFLGITTVTLFGCGNATNEPSSNDSQRNDGQNAEREKQNMTPEEILAMLSLTPSPTPTSEPTPAATMTPTPTATPTLRPIEISEQMRGLYELNNDVVGYISMKGTKQPEIDYPVVQTFDDPTTPNVDESQYYLKKGLDKKKLERGTLFMDPDSESGVGYKEDLYAGGIKPSTVMMIYGHNMKKGLMFGYLYLFLDHDYAMQHRYIQYKTLYEDRTYMVVSVFRSHVFYEFQEMSYSKTNDPFFKYYKFTGDMDKETFDYWYANVCSHDVTGLPAHNVRYGDEFLVLSTCGSEDEYGNYNELGRLCLVAVRVD